YASVMIAQAILESGYGSSALSNAPYYNLFGVKGSYNGQSVYMPTQEYLNGQWVEMNEPFRQYNSYWESFQDHANVLRSPSFATGTAHYSGVWKSQTTSFYDATNYLTGRYATDPGYAQKLNWLIETYQLTRFDT
ncbi:N-acetylmuramoyl-L-alanine amidase, partial [Escherichia coli]